MKAILKKPIDGLEVGGIFEIEWNGHDYGLDVDVWTNDLERIGCFYRDEDLGEDEYGNPIEGKAFYDYFLADWFVLQELPETITEQIEKKIRYEIYGMRSTCRNRDPQEVDDEDIDYFTGGAVSAVKELLEGQEHAQ